MDAGNSGGSTSFATPEDRENLLAQLRVEQVERDKQQAERDEQRAERLEQLQVEQAERDKQQAGRDEQRAERLEQLQVEQVEQVERDKQRAERLEQLQVEQAERDKQRAGREIRQARWQLLQLVTALGTIAALGISLWALLQGKQNLTQQQVALRQGYENLQQQQAAAAQQDQASRYSSISQLSLELDKAIADQPDLICYLRYCDTPKPVLNTKETQHAKQLAGYIVDFYQYLYDQLYNLKDVPDSGLFTLRKDVAPGEGDENWITWSETIVDGFKYSTMACQALIDGVPAYGWNFVHAVAHTHVCQGLKDPGQSPY